MEIYKLRRRYKPVGVSPIEYYIKIDDCLYHIKMGGMSGKQWRLSMPMGGLKNGDFLQDHDDLVESTLLDVLVVTGITEQYIKDAHQTFGDRIDHFIHKTGVLDGEQL